MLGQSVYALVMVAHIPARVILHEFNRSSRPNLGDPHLMQGVGGVARVSAPVAVEPGIRKVGVQTPAAVHVHDLQPSAYAQTGQALVQYAVEQQVFNTVALRINAAAFQSVFRLTISARMDVFPTRQNHSASLEHLKL
jgi:hypothetical protein